MAPHQRNTPSPRIRLRRFLGTLPILGLCLTGMAAPSAQAQQMPLSVQTSPDLLESSVPKVSGACPGTVIVASRGTDQNGPEDLQDGFAGPNINAMLAQLQQRHGASAPVIALPPELYPAEIETPDILGGEEDLGPSEMLARVRTTLAETPLSQMWGTALESFTESAKQGVVNTQRAIEFFERTTGCKPKYLLVGYSQGALVNAPIELWLIERGQLAGVANLGDPLHSLSGQLHQASQRIPEAARLRLGVAPRASLCVQGDFACWPTPDTPAQLTDGNAGVHGKYFLDLPPSPGQREAEAVFLKEVAAMLEAN